MEFKANEYARLLKQEADDNECAQADPHCPKLMGDLCHRGCFEVRVDLQTMTVMSSDE